VDDQQGSSGNLYESELVAVLLERAYELATGPLAGIEDAAKELAQLAGDSVTVSTARRIVLSRVEGGGGPSDQQVASLLRRAIELGGGRWDWDDTRPVP
jgi:hypothetical protein